MNAGPPDTRPGLPRLGLPRLGLPLLAAAVAPVLVSIAVGAALMHRSEVGGWTTVSAAFGLPIGIAGAFLIGRPLLLRQIRRHGGLRLASVALTAVAIGAISFLAFGTWLQSSLSSAFGGSREPGAWIYALFAGVGAGFGLTAALAFWFAGGRKAAA